MQFGMVYRDPGFDLDPKAVTHQVFSAGQRIVRLSDLTSRYVLVRAPGNGVKAFFRANPHAHAYPDTAVRILSGAIIGVYFDSKEHCDAALTSARERWHESEFKIDARIAKFRIITTPLPQACVKHSWLYREIVEAVLGPVPLGKPDYICLESALHKSTLFPDP